MTQDDLWQLFLAKELQHWGVTKEDLPLSGIPDGFLPNSKDIFRSLEELQPSAVKFLFLGQDPYWTTCPDGTPHATGVAFTVPHSAEAPPSLRKIMNKIGSTELDLHTWRNKHGVLLLNAALTVPQPLGKENGSNYAGKHLGIWEKFTTKIISKILHSNPDAMLIALGIKPKNLIAKIVNSNHPSSENFIWSYHPQARFVSINNPKNFQQLWLHPKLNELLPTN